MNIDINDAKFIKLFNDIKSEVEYLDEEIIFYSNVSKPIKKNYPQSDPNDTLCFNCYWDYYCEEGNDGCINCRNGCNYKWKGIGQIRELGDMINALDVFIRQAKKNK